MRQKRIKANLSGNDIQHMGNYDSRENQIFICANNLRKEGAVHAFLARQLVEMFDRYSC